jgi:hypothetical protein
MRGYYRVHGPFSKLVDGRTTARFPPRKTFATGGRRLGIVGSRNDGTVRVIIGMDPHKRSATIEIINGRENVLAQGRFGADRDGYQAMLKLGRQHKDRIWAVEGCDVLAQTAVLHRVVVVVAGLDVCLRGGLSTAVHVIKHEGAEPLHEQTHDLRSGRLGRAPAAF